MKKITLSAIFAVSCFYNVHAQDLEGILQRYIRNNSLQFKKSDLGNFTIDNKDHSKSLNGDVIKIQQTYNGLPIFNAVSTALVRDNNIVYYIDGFEKDYGRSDHAMPLLNPKQAFDMLATALVLKDKQKYTIVNFNDKVFRNIFGAKQRLLYTKNNENLELCYEFVLSENDSYWDILINAKTGKMISKISLKTHCNFAHHPYQAENTLSYANKELYHPGSVHSSILSADNASYNVFELPIEAPSFGARSMVSNPWIPSSSPEGWHSDGTNHYTTTQGNNIIAFTLGSDPGTSPLLSEGGSTRNFNFPFDDNTPTASNMDASVVNVFYSTNMAHDILYRLGFTESARNFQINNFGKGGTEGDPVLSSVLQLPTNNAAFVNYPDGTPGELSVQFWNEDAFLYYHLPVVAQNRNARTVKASFGSQLDATGITGDVLSTSIIDGCTPLPTASLDGKMGLIRSGNCTDDVKVKNAQNAGAVAAVIYESSQTGNLTKMTGTDPSITIPSVKILNSEGVYMKSLLENANTVNITLKNDPALEKEKNMGFDNVVVMHEYAHGLSNRLTGTGYSCLNPNISAEQMGEGWSDFYAMMFTNRPDHTAATARGIGTYLVNEPTTGIGIRPSKYSTDFSVNNYTYGKTNGMQYTNPEGDVVPEKHGIGFVWATMLWDLHWKYAEKYGYSSDILANTTNGSTRVLQLVTDALKLQACNPTFIDGRNAILAVDQVATGGADKCMIWSVFAKRGLGVNASADSETSINDQVEDFTVPAECTLATDNLRAIKNTISIYPNPAKDQFLIYFPSDTLGKVSVEMYDMSGKLVFSEDKVSPDTKKSVSTNRFTNGIYMVKIKGVGINTVSKVIVKK